MEDTVVQQVHQEAIALIESAGMHLSSREYDDMVIIDFGLGDLRREGVEYVDILLSERLRITVLALLPHQTLPQHVHPPYDDCGGKEETVRVVAGEFRVYVPGPDTMANGHIVDCKDAWYTARHEQVLLPTDTYTIDPDVLHWFQAGPEGAVTLGFYNRVDETRNVFTDPSVSAICGAGVKTEAAVGE